MNEKQLKNVINAINSLIYESVRHGGDAGGPYYINNERIFTATYNLILALGIERDVIIIYDEIPKLV